MESLTNTSFLCQQLIKINKKYESNSFVDIDFIKLFGLCPKTQKTQRTLEDINLIKKKMTAKYYNLALKYHPDKFVSSTESILNIINCFVSIDEIKSGEFLSFINDIYEMFNQMIVEDPESLINIINGKTEDILNKFDMNSDYYNLKRRFDTTASKDYLKATDQQMREFEEELNKVKIADAKINESQLKNLIECEQGKRETLKVDRMFSETEQTNPEFNKIFNDAFDNTKNTMLNVTDTGLDTFSGSNDIMAYNFNTNYDLSTGISSANASNFGAGTSISDISEAFGPIRVNNMMKTQQMTFEDMLAQRDSQDKMFKNPKLSKQNT
jgi:hypothetical protein